jgi:hypothetical protein
MAGFGSLTSPLGSTPRNRSPYGDERLYPVSPWQPRTPVDPSISAGRLYNGAEIEGWLLNQPQAQTERGTPIEPQPYNPDPPSRLEPSPGFARYLREHLATSTEDDSSFRMRMATRLMADPMLRYQYAWNQIRGLLPAMPWQQQQAPDLDMWWNNRPAPGALLRNR